MPCQKNITHTHHITISYSHIRHARPCPFPMSTTVDFDTAAHYNHFLLLSTKPVPSEKKKPEKNTENSDSFTEAKKKKYEKRQSVGDAPSIWHIPTLHGLCTVTSLTIRPPILRRQVRLEFINFSSLRNIEKTYLLFVRFCM